MLDNHIQQGNELQIDTRQIVWKRCLDMNDRVLRNIVVGLGSKMDGTVREDHFVITVASEIMAILCLAKDEDDLRRRIENILLGYTYDNKPFYVKDMGVAGAITVLLKDALSPNLVQTTENTPAFVHGGPFANIAHGCNSILATKLAMTFGEYAITEAGFGADLGAEKFFNIKCRKAGINPKLTVLVVTARALKMHGGVAQDIVGQPNLEALKIGIANMDKHLENLAQFGQTVVVAFNRYGDDVQEEIDYVRQHCSELGIGFAVNNAFVEGGAGAVELAELVVKTIDENPSKELEFVYGDDDNVKTKITKVADKQYGASLVTFSPTAKKKMAMIEELGYSHFPICIAKTQYSFSTNPKLINVPKDFEFHVQDIVINAGAEMLVVISGEIMRMPGLPKVPQAMHIDIVDGQIEGLS